MASEPRKIVFILGNGFDLDLGLKTSYKDFWESDYCPRNYPAPLIKHLNERWGENLENVRWYDLENELLNYALHGDKSDVITPEERDYLNSIKDNPIYHLTIDARFSSDQEKVNVINSLIRKDYIIVYRTLPYKVDIPYKDDIYQPISRRDKRALSLIKEGLCNYLKYNVKKMPDYENTVAYQLLLHFAHARIKGWSVDIYTFNYTDIKQLVDGLLESIPIHYMHGNVIDDNLIIGTKDDKDLDKDYDFLQKAMDPSFNPPPIVKKLQEAEEVVIFGHSLGENDRQYFAPFFNDQINNQESKKTTIFTYDYKSEEEIKRALQKITDSHLSMLYSINKLTIIKTSELKNNSKTLRDFLLEGNIRLDMEVNKFIDRLIEKEEIVKTKKGQTY